MGEDTVREIIQQGQTYCGSTGEPGSWVLLQTHPGSFPGKIRAVIRSFDQSILPVLSPLNGEILKEGPTFRREEWPLMANWPAHVRVML